MLQLKAIHMVAGYALACSVAVRIYWAFVGDRGASWRSFFPFLKRGGWAKIVAEMRFYAFLRRDPPASSAVVNMSHAVVFLAFGVEIVTGFALLGLGGGHGIAAALLGWPFALVAPQEVRLIHATVMWFLIAFTLEHIYITVLLDCRARSGLMSSIVTGYMGHERH
jgi:Ni/Fe-hydrogenase 1 B-type cytochrome subunit